MDSKFFRKPTIQILKFCLCSSSPTVLASFFGGDEWKLSAVIPEDYNKAVPPGLALGNETTETTVSIAIDSMDSITEKTMVLYYVTFLATVPTCSPRILFDALCSKTHYFCTTVLQVRHVLLPPLEGSKVSRNDYMQHLPHQFFSAVHE